MKSSMLSLAPFVVLVLVLAGCGTTPPVPVQSDPVPSDSSPRTGETASAAPLEITLLRMRYVFAIGTQEPLEGTIELDGTCVVLDGAAVVFPNVAHVDAEDRLSTPGATLQIGADIEDVLAWGLVPIEGSRLPATDTRIDDEGLVGLEHCPPSNYEEYIFLGNIDPTE